MLILGIESSCDETGVALYDSETGNFVHHVHTQIALHAQYGGVVPELASRDHIRHVAPLVKACLDTANKTPQDIDKVAYTAGPGLSGALLVGASFAQSFAFAHNLPVIPVHHLEAHILSSFLASPKPHFPFIALLISGGHTQFFIAQSVGHYQLIGETLDDAAGEVFDKVAKLLDLPYPGGAQLSALAKLGRLDRFTLPRPLHGSNHLMMSFSGLKTAVVKLLKQQGNSIDDATRHDICCAFQYSMVNVLVSKAKLALEQTKIKNLVVAGGVSLNEQLRDGLRILSNQIDCHVFYPPTDLCMDNGAMIAFAGAMHAKEARQAGSFAVYPKWPLGELISH